MYYTTQVAQLPFTCSTSSPTRSRSGLVPFSSTQPHTSSRYLASQKVPTWVAQDRTSPAPLRHTARGGAGSLSDRCGSSSDFPSDPYFPGPLPLSVQAGLPTSLTRSPASLAKQELGLVAQPRACAPSACTATRLTRLPTMRGSNAPANLVDEGPSQGSLALEDWQPRYRVYPEDLPGHASIRTPRLLPGFQAPSQLHCTCSGCAPAGTV